MDGGAWFDADHPMPATVHASLLGALRSATSHNRSDGVAPAAVLALCGALLEKSLRGGLIAVGGLNLGGGIDPVYNAVSVAELAVDRGRPPSSSRSPASGLSIGCPAT